MRLRRLAAAATCAADTAQGGDRLARPSMPPTSSSWPSGARPTGWPTRPGRPATCSARAIRTSSTCRCCPTRLVRRSCRRTPRRTMRRVGFPAEHACGAIRPRRCSRWPGTPCGAARPAWPSIWPGGHPGRPRLRAGAAAVRLSEVPRPVAHGLRGEEAAGGLRLERQVRLAAQRPSAPLRAGAAVLRRPLDFGRRGRPAASRHPLRLGRRDRALHDPHQPQHRGRRGAGREARTALSPLAADVRPLLRLGGRRGGDVRRPARSRR